MKTMQNILTGLGLTVSGLVFFSTPAFATFTEPSSSNEDIVVTGNKTTKAAIAQFIKTTIATPEGGRHDGQYARLANPVCPKVVGLSDENRDQVEQRMRGVALAADMRVAQKGCKPNVFVMVVADGDEAVSTLSKKRSRLFGNMSHYARKRIAKSGGPAYAWKRIQTASAETGALQNSDEITPVPSDQGPVTEVPIMHSSVKSNIKRTVQKDMTHSFLLLEKDALVGLTTLQIADYAAMRSYIDTRDSQTRQTPRYSILALFDSAKDSEEIPSSVSEMDLMLLSSLYNTPSDVSASMQSSAMVHQIGNELTSRADN